MTLVKLGGEKLKFHGMAKESDFDNREFRRKVEAMRRLPDANDLEAFTSNEESSPFCRMNQIHPQTRISREIHEYDYDLGSKSSRSVAEYRIINPAIYAESFEDEENCGDHAEKLIVKSQIHSRQFDDPSKEPVAGSKYSAAALADGVSILSICNGEDSTGTVDVDGDHAPGTYRCFPSVTSTTTSSSLNSDEQSRPMKRIERRCKISDELRASWESRSSENLCHASAKRDDKKSIQRCSLNGLKNIQCSTTSLSTTNLSEKKRLVDHAEWVREKEREALRIKEEKRRAEQRKKDQEERSERERVERERRERESFLRWAERKKKEEEAKQEAIERQLEFQRCLKEVEDKAVVAKTICLRQWARKKEEEQKAQQKKQQLELQQKEDEKKKRLEESEKAYEKWREKSKDKPKPATQAHQKAKPAFVNPNPWQQIIEDEEELDEPKDPRKDYSEKRKVSKLGSDKIKGRKTRSTHQS